MTTNFIELETNGCCFYCLRGQDSQPNKFGTVSLRRLVHHLKINFKNIIGERAPPESLDILSGDELKASFCVNCENLLNKTLVVFKELELIQLKLDYYLNLTREKIELSLKDKVNLREIPDYKIVEELRETLANKCSILTKQPKIILERVGNTAADSTPVVSKALPPIKQEPLFEETDCDAASFDQDLFPKSVKAESEKASSPIPPKLKPKRTWKYKRQLHNVHQIDPLPSGSNGKIIKRYKCDKCPKLFSWRQSLYAHLNTVHLGKGVLCHLCPRVSINNAAHEIHLEEHKKWQLVGVTAPEGKHKKVIRPEPKPKTKKVIHDQKPKNEDAEKSEGALFQCEICGNCYSREHTLKEHRRSYHERIKLKCSLCPFTCNYSSGIAQHRRFFHKGQEFRKKHEIIEASGEPEFDFVPETKKYQCKLCGKGFSSQGTLSTHRRSVHLGVKHPCPHCGRLFTQNGQMNLHMRVACQKRPDI